MRFRLRAPLPFAFPLPAAHCCKSMRVRSPAPPVSHSRSVRMSKASIITDMRIRVLRTLRRAARSHRKQEAHLLAQGAEVMQACLEAREARDTAAIDAARRAIKSARISRAEHEWASRRAHSAANLPTHAPNAPPRYPHSAPRPYGRGGRGMRPAVSAPVVVRLLF